MKRQFKKGMRTVDLEEALDRLFRRRPLIGVRTLQHRWNEDHKFQGVFGTGLSRKKRGFSRIQKLTFSGNTYTNHQWHC